jgi:hypothetical protein
MNVLYFLFLFSHATIYTPKTDWLDSLMRGSGQLVETEMTESILSEARDVALDILRGMRTVAVTHASEAEELQSIFNAR